MNLRKKASKFFRSNGASSSSVAPSMSNAQRARGPPPMPAMPAISELRIAAPTPPKIQKAPKPPVQVALITNEMIRELRELIRYRYALDCKIWSVGRKVKWYQRDTIEADMRRSDAALATIRSTLDGWDRREYFATIDEYKKFKDIKNRIVDSRTRNWSENPPWAKQDPEPDDGLHEKDGRAVHPSYRSSLNGRYSNGF